MSRDGVEEQSITFRVFKRHYYENDDYLSTFKIELYNPSLNTELGDIAKMVVYYYDDEFLMNDVGATDISINGTYNIYSAPQQNKSIPLVVGLNYTFFIRSYLYYNMPKQNGNDMFIVRFLFANGTQAEVDKSYNVVNELYYINFVIKSMDIAVAKVYAVSPGHTMNYYDNTQFLSLPFISRIETNLPYWFTNEVRSRSYFSLRIESFLIFNFT